MGERIWSLADLFLLRVAGLPFESLDRMHAADSTRWAGAVLRGEQDLRERATRLSDLLERAVSAHTDDPPLRKLLINVRRDVFNLRPLRDRAAVATLAGRLDPAVATEVAAWLHAFDRQDAAVAEGAQIVERDLRRQRDGLRAVAAEPALRHALLLASPMLDQQLYRYVDQAAGTLDKRARRVERSLLEYVARAVAKTSPFSTFTSVGLGMLGDDEPDLVRLAGAAQDARGVARLNVAVLARLAASIAENEKLRADLPTRLTTGAEADDTRVRYLRRRSSAATSDTDMAAALDLVHDDLFLLPSGGLIARVLDVLADDRELRLGDLVDLLAAGERTGEAAGDLEHADIERYLGHLLRLGLLVLPSLHLNIHHPQPPADFSGRLAATGQPWAAGLAARLDRVDDAVRAYPLADVGQRRETLATIRDELAVAQSDLGVSTSLPRTLLYEDAVLRTRVAASRQRWSTEFLPTLRDIAELLPLFDLNLPRRVSTKGYFRVRYGAGGRCDDFLAFAHEFLADFFQQYTTRLFARRAFDDENRYISLENYLNQPELPALDGARLALVERVAELYGALPEGSEELVLDEESLRAVTALLPRRAGEVPSWTFFGQLAAEDLVLNRCYPGLTLPFSRFAHGFEDVTLVPRLRDLLAQARPPGAVFAELTGGYEASNLNLHPPVTPYELVCPGELSLRPAAEQIPIEDLSIRDDATGERLRLWSTRLDREVIPVYLGFLVPILLPEIQQVLLAFSSTGMAQPDLWAGVPAVAETAAVTTVPRIRYRNVVIQRRSWRVPADALPARGVDVATAFLDWTRWRQRHDIPRRVFATVSRGRAPDAAAAGADRAGGFGGRKPSYVDFEQHLSLAAVGDLARGADRVVLTEMLPGPEDLWLRDPNGSYVAELALQVTATGRTDA